MTGWAAGYVADVGYTTGFYPETAPSHMAFAALATGRAPGRALAPRRVLELGFGQGFGLALLAAANPDVAFEGYDFNPEHVAHARRLIAGAGLENLTVSETGFEEAAARGGDNDVDVIATHGILSWVARPIQDAIVDIVRQRLQPDGILYLSYNCMPGWAPVAPLRRMMLEVKRRNPGGSERQLARAFDLIGRLRQGNALYFAANPAAARHLDAMLRMDRSYLAHEYLDEQWDLFWFSDVAALLSEAKLTYVASATLAENLDTYAVPQELRALIRQIDDPVLRETTRDIAGNKWFRRDLFARGSAASNPVERRNLLSTLAFALVVPRRRVSLKFSCPLGELTAKDELYRPIVDRLAHGNARFDDLLALPAFGEERLGVLVDCLTLLVHSGQVLPVTGAPNADAQPAQRFNRMIVDSLRGGRSYHHLAAPVVRTGLAVPDFGLLALAALLEGKDDGPAAARHALPILKSLGRWLVKGGRAIESDGEAEEFLAGQIGQVLQDYGPLWRRLGCLPDSVDPHMGLAAGGVT
jgi:SAM-dependent methyltransferase